MAENAQLSNAPEGVANEAETAILSSMPTESASASSNTAADVQAQVQAAKPLPTANLTATHPSDAYRIEDLVPNGLSTLHDLPGVQEWQEAVLAGRSVTTTSRYVARRVEPVVKSGNVTHIQLLRFIFLLIEFIRSLRAPGRGPSTTGPGGKRLPPRDDLRHILSSLTGSTPSKKKPAPPATTGTRTVPDSIINAICGRFVPNGGSNLSKNDVILLHTTLCALSLHIPPLPAADGGSSSQGGNSPNELATDPSDLRDDLRLGNTTILQYFRELGCRVDKPREAEFAKWGIKGGKAEAASKRVARLRIPLQFPKMSRGGPR